jgi:hypothetical protein
MLTNQVTSSITTGKYKIGNGLELRPLRDIDHWRLSSELLNYVTSKLQFEWSKWSAVDIRDDILTQDFVVC